MGRVTSTLSANVNFTPTVSVLRGTAGQTIAFDNDQVQRVTHRRVNVHCRKL